MSIASYDAHRRRMKAIADLKAAADARAEAGRVNVHWAAVVYGAAVALYVGGLIYVLAWLVPEILEFTQ